MFNKRILVYILYTIKKNFWNIVVHSYKIKHLYAMYNPIAYIILYYITVDILLVTNIFEAYCAILQNRNSRHHFPECYSYRIYGLCDWLMKNVQWAKKTAHFFNSSSHTSRKSFRRCVTVNEINGSANTYLSHWLVCHLEHIHNHTWLNDWWVSKIKMH